MKGYSILSSPTTWFRRARSVSDVPARHYLTTAYNSTFVRTFNIAHGAATIDRTVVPPHQFLNWTHTFREQVDDIFVKTYTDVNPAATWDPDKTLFAIWFGVVDISLLVDQQKYQGDNVLRMVKAYAQILDDVRHFTAYLL